MTDFFMKETLTLNWINYLFTAFIHPHQAHIIHKKPVYKKPSTSASKELRNFWKKQLFCRKKECYRNSRNSRRTDISLEE